jgi:hypothetical protein
MKRSWVKNVLRLSQRFNVASLKLGSFQFIPHFRQIITADFAAGYDGLRGVGVSHTGQGVQAAQAGVQPSHSGIYQRMFFKSANRKSGNSWVQSEICEFLRYARPQISFD